MANDIIQARTASSEDERTHVRLLAAALPNAVERAAGAAKRIVHGSRRLKLPGVELLSWADTAVYRIGGVRVWIRPASDLRGNALLQFGYYVARGRERLDLAVAGEWDVAECEQADVAALLQEASIRVLDAFQDRFSSRNARLVDGIVFPAAGEA